MTCNTNGNNMDNNKLANTAGDLLVWELCNPSNVVNLGGVKALDITTDTDSERVEIAAHNRTSITGNSPAGLISVQFLENVDVEKIKILSNASVTSIAGTLVNLTDEKLGTGWTIGNAIKLYRNNGDKTIVTNIVIKADGTTLVEDTDYSVYLADGTNGEAGYTYILPITAQTGVLTADYDYTPNASAEARTTRKYAADKLLGAKIVTEANADGKVNTYTLESCVFKGQYKISVVDLAIAGDLEGTTGTFELSRGADIVHNIETI